MTQRDRPGPLFFVPNPAPSSRPLFIVLCFQCSTKRYLQIPCACMTPNTGRFDVLKQQVESLKPELVIDIVLQSCHTYNVEAFKVESYAREDLGTNYLKVVTDFS